MPRQARLDAPGVLQHVMARGIERRKIFWNDKDRASFLERLAIILEETQTQCYAWTLIPNHFHLLLRTGPTPLSTVMRRLMTGYAVTFNIRHRRSGHLFQNRYKSVVCEEDAYLLELTRYIHLNPLRAKLIEDLKTLDKYPWTGHSVLLGKRKNPLVPEIPPAIGEDKFLAEKTVEDVLKYFGGTFKIARRRYREFVEKGIKHGRRTDLQGGGLVRSAGGDKRGLLGRKKGEREKGDERILGSGDFVSGVMKKTNELMDDRAKFTISLQDLVSKVCSKFEIRFDELTSRRRKRNLSQARAVLCYLAVDKLGYSGENMARTLRISGRSVGACRDRGEKILDNPEIISEYLM
jgi:REP-associated tyrosine transposase